jgi:signal transduction histidine kinase
MLRKRTFLDFLRMPETWGFFLFLCLALVSIYVLYDKVPSIVFLLISGSFGIGAIAFIINLLSMGEKEVEVEFGTGEFERMVTDLHDGIIGYDNSFRITVFNPAAESIFRINGRDIIGKTVSPDMISNPQLKTLVQLIFPSLAPSVIKKSAPGAYPQVVDIDFTDPELYLTTSTNRVLDRTGKIVGFFKIVRNRTREVGLLRDKSDFISVAAHQLRTPMTAIHWIFENLTEDSALSPSDKEVAMSGLAASIKMLKIVNDLLDVSRIEAGRFGYKFSQVDLSQFFSSMVGNANNLAKEFGVSIFFTPPVTPSVIHGDPQRLGMAFSNIIDNAIRYNVKNGQVVIDIKRVPDKPYIEITVKDTGIGMDRDDMNKLFTKFFRGANAIKEQSNGSGLGLFIAKNIISRHGGKISAESIVGRGSIFHILIPLDPMLIPQREIALED